MIYLELLLAVIILVCLVCLWRFIVLKKPNKTGKVVIDEVLAETLAKSFSQMVQIKTLSYQGSNKAAFIELKQTMESLFPNVFKTMVKKEFPGESLLMHWKGLEQTRPMLIMSHLDVVGVDASAWTEKPFGGEIKSGEIFGRGTLDTKSTVYAFYKACEDLIKSGFTPNQDIYLFSSTDEEIQGNGAPQAVEYLKSIGVKPYLVLDEGGAIVTNGLPGVTQPLAMVGIVEKGYANIKFKALSKGGHSSTPPKNTPIARLSAFVNDVEKHFPLKTKMIPEVENIFKVAAPYMKGFNRFLFINMWLFKPLLVKLLPKLSAYGRALLSTTIAFTMMEGSKAVNVIPSEASITANLRIHPIQNTEDCFNTLQKIAAKYDVEAELLQHRNESKMVDISHKQYQYLKQTIHSVFPDVDVSPYLMLGATDARHFDLISDHALRFSPIRMDQSELSKMHGHDESIHITTLVEAVNFYQTLIKNHQ